jgi:hypothetical protein
VDFLWGFVEIASHRLIPHRFGGAQIFCPSPVFSNGKTVDPHRGLTYRE